jgi:hypothetical protein
MIAMGGVRTSTIKPLYQSDDLDIGLGTTNFSGKNVAFNVKNVLGETVASIDSSGSAKFNEISMSKYTDATSSATVIARDANFEENGLYASAIKTNTKTAGIGIVPAHENEIVVYNEKVNENSLIYVTATSPTENKTLFVADKKICTETDGVACKNYFKVAIDGPINTDIKFNWWIVN